MKRLRILLVLGSRPEAIKLAPVMQALRRAPEHFEPVLCSTGQQLHMAPQALAEFGLVPDVDLSLMAPDQTLADLTARLIVALDKTIETVAPDWVVVQGDTTSAMAGALCAFYRRIRVAHVEAGMRTDNMWSPFPEEANRRIISQCATLHLAPTEWCRGNLLREGMSPARIHVTGNTVVDALHDIRRQILSSPSRLPEELSSLLIDRRLLLVTMHRRESFNGGLANICEALTRICERVPDVVAVLPVHPNPRVQATVVPMLRNSPRVTLVEPLPYRPFLELMERAYLILTDSGGLQEEAPSFGKPLLVLRDTTERPEGIASGVACLVGTDPRTIEDAALRLLENRTEYLRMAGSPNPYGDGRAADRVAAALRDPESPLLPTSAPSVDHFIPVAGIHE
jgi:UDP-N-acetylglucosamine 2-epimerase